MSPDKQTNKQTSDNYISVRVTLPHKDVDQVVKVASGYNYCIYLHKAGTDNEHFHVCFPGGQPDAIRQRFKRAWPDRGGNGFICVKSFQNGLYNFVRYGHHEGAEPIFKEESWKSIIEEGLSYGVYKKRDKEEQSGTVKKVRERLSNPQLTRSNLLRQAVKYAREHNTGTLDLGSVLKRMVNDGWDPDHGLWLHGATSDQYDIFAARMTGKSIEEQDWMKPHKRPDRTGDVPEIDTDYQFTKRTKLIPKPHD